MAQRKNFQDVCRILGENGCLAFCYGYVIGLDETDVLCEFNELVGSEILGADGYVLDADKFMRFYGRNDLRVLKGTIGAAARADASPYVCVQWKSNGRGHWVVERADTREIKYNSLARSKCVLEGKPDYDDVRYFARR